MKGVCQQCKKEYLTTEIKVEETAPILALQQKFCSEDCIGEYVKTLQPESSCKNCGKKTDDKDFCATTCEHLFADKQQKAFQIKAVVSVSIISLGIITTLIALFPDVNPVVLVLDFIIGFLVVFTLVPKYWMRVLGIMIVLIATRSSLEEITIDGAFTPSIGLITGIVLISLYLLARYLDTLDTEI